MPTNEQIADVCRQRFKAQVADALALPTIYDNAPDVNPAEARWARLSVVFGDAQQVSLGEVGMRRFRSLGLLIAQVFVPFQQGDEQALQTCDAIVQAFRGVTVSGVVFRAPGLSAGRRAGDWWQVNVTCPWYADSAA